MYNKSIFRGGPERSVHRTRTEAQYSLGARHDWSKKLSHFEHKLVCRFINLPACSAILEFKNYQAYAAVILILKLYVSSLTIYINYNS